MLNRKKLLLYTISLIATFLVYLNCIFTILSYIFPGDIYAQDWLSGIILIVVMILSWKNFNDECKSKLSYFLSIIVPFIFFAILIAGIATVDFSNIYAQYTYMISEIILLFIILCLHVSVITTKEKD